MQTYKIEDMKNGWFIGNFEPSIVKTNDFEVSYKCHKKDEILDIHYHDTVTEINLITKGEVIIQNKIFKKGDIFVLFPFEIADPIFPEDCEIVCIKMPSKNDKVSIIRK